MDSVFNQSLFFMNYVAHQHPLRILKGGGERVRRSYYYVYTMAAAKEMSQYAVIVTVSSELDGIFK